MQTGHARLAQALERGAFARPRLVARVLERAWEVASRRSVVRALGFAPDTRVVAVGGAVLGGSGKTPLALACARALGRRCEVALVGHGYRASPGRARIVRPDDDVAVVGDEALACARALEQDGVTGVRVVVAPRRQDAVRLAETLARTLVLDGVLQTSPRRADLALLALDAQSPWGRGRMPPSGDLRAPRAAMLEACDRAVVVGEGTGADARVVSCGARLGEVLLGWGELASARVGLFTALARPWRLGRFLARHGVVPVAALHAGDHRAPRALVDRARRLTCERAIDVWLATAKCRTHVTEASGSSIPIGVLDHRLVLSPELEESLSLPV